MQKKFKAIIFIGFLLLSNITIQAEWEDRFGEPKVVNLATILENPESWVDIPVRIPLRFQSFRQVYTAFFSSFDRENYLNFSAWDTLTPIWEKEGFLNDYPFFYIEKDNKELKSFLKLRRFDTISVLAKVNSVFRGKAYIRVVYVCTMPGNVNVHNLTLLNQASVALKERRFDQALTGYEKVLPTRPPEDIRAMIHKTKAKVLAYEKKDYKGAIRELKRGLKHAKNDGEMKALLKHCRYFVKHGGHPPQAIVKATVLSEEEEEAKREETTLDNGNGHGNGHDNGHDNGYEKKDEVKPDPVTEEPGTEYEEPASEQPIEESVE